MDKLRWLWLKKKDMKTPSDISGKKVANNRYPWVNNENFVLHLVLGDIFECNFAKKNYKPS